MRTGYWIMDKSRTRQLTVHIEHAGKPFCASHVDPTSTFIPCLPGVEIEFVTCGTCQIKYKSHLQEIINNMMAKFLTHKPHRITVDVEDDDVKVA